MSLLSRFAGLALASLAACGPGEVPFPDDVEVSRSGVARQLFGTIPDPAALPTAPYGSYSEGCLAGAAALPETGATWQAMRLSRNRNWGHPEALDMVQRLSRVAAARPESNGIYVGDISQPRGGPMLTGHRSHQIGLDADVWLMPATLGLSRQQREEISAISYRRANGAYVNDRWGPYQQAVVKAAARDPRTARIFIFPGAKVAMCDAETGDRSWLRKVRPWWGHHYHFHVRLACPDGAPGCVDQDPPPPGDGCDQAREWQRNILDPQPPEPPDPDIPAPAPSGPTLMSDLPQACQAVLQR